ncbi:hypothetical protein SCO01_04520 [Staphylococcus cohnii subsp. cohnii]|nr:hypothetical protein SCO01_04520 [Staphylococcus cohnii subsp. cohnii]
MKNSPTNNTKSNDKYNVIPVKPINSSDLELKLKNGIKVNIRLMNNRIPQKTIIPTK